MASWSNQLMMERNIKKTNQPTSLPATHPFWQSGHTFEWACLLCFVRAKGEISWTRFFKGTLILDRLFGVHNYGLSLLHIYLFLITFI